MSYPAYPEYKDSGVEWLGEVPTHWEVVKLSYLAISKGGGTPPKDELQYWNGSIPWVTPKDMKRQWITSTIDTLSEAALHASPVSMVEPGHVLIVFRSGILRNRIPVAINKVPVTVNQDVRAYNVRPRLLPDFFLRLTQGLNRELLPEWSKQGATVESLDSELVNSTQLPVPSRGEQEAITTFLDHETARIDALVEEQQRLIELLKEKRQAVISHAVTKGLDPDVPMKNSGVEWLGEVPEHWDVVAIKWLSPVQRGASPRPIDDPIYFDENGEYGWVRIADVSASNGKLLSTSQTLSALGSSLSVKLEPGQLFISIAGTVGKPCITKIKACIHDGFVYFPEISIDPRFLFTIFESGLCYKGLGKMGTQLNLNTDTVGGIKIALPSEDEVKKILLFLSHELNRLDELSSQAWHVTQLLQERRSALISAAVTGKIDVRSWQPPADSVMTGEAKQMEAV